MANTIQDWLGDKAELLLGFNQPKIPKEHLHLPGPDWVDRIFAATDRNNRVLVNLQRLFGTGRLAHTGYLSILPVDQGIEHSAGASFAKNPAYFDPENIVRLALEGGCNAVASTYGVLGSVARRYAHKFPFLSKLTTTSCSPTPIRLIKSCMAPFSSALIWARRPWAPPSTLARPRAAGRLWR
jgi:fructose-bisphosphate aldolase, class I